MAHNQPETPTPTEQQLVTQWLDLFRQTITCPTCKGHFGEMLEQYRKLQPQQLSSRREFLLFTQRAHNTVNRRLDKPLQMTNLECEEVYRRNIESRSARDQRVAQLNHIQRHWRSMHDAMGIIGIKQVREMMRVETDQWGLRETTWSDPELHSTAPLPKAVSAEVRRFVPRRPGGMVFRNGRLQFLV